MKLTRVAVLGVAVGAGLVAAFIALNLTGNPPPAEETSATPPPAVEATKVLVAADDIPIGSTLKPDSVRWVDWPSSGISEKFITRVGTGEAQIEPVVGALARASFYNGEPITASKLIHTDQGFMAAILPSGMRAVATKIAADTSAGGFILPNDRVDVIMTRRKADAGTGTNTGPQFETETILNNVRVLAIDQTIEDQNGEKVVVGQTATLELTPQQAEILTVAQQTSDRLTLALRSVADSRKTPADAENDAVHLIGGTKNGGAVTIVKNGVVRNVDTLR
jgi:pilus assembly protein CpaB